MAALLFLLSMSFLLNQQVLAFHIRPHSCKNSYGDIGTCMFVWECIKTEGKHLGTCVDGFLFGSCCAHNESSNSIAQGNPVSSNPTSSVTQPSLNGSPSSSFASQNIHSSSVHQETTSRRPNPSSGGFTYEHTRNPVSTFYTTRRPSTHQPTPAHSLPTSAKPFIKSTTTPATVITGYWFRPSSSIMRPASSPLPISFTTSVRIPTAFSTVKPPRPTRPSWKPQFTPANFTDTFTIKTTADATSTKIYSTTSKPVITMEPSLLSSHKPVASILSTTSTQYGWLNNNNTTTERTTVKQSTQAVVTFKPFPTFRPTWKPIIITAPHPIKPTSEAPIKFPTASVDAHSTSIPKTSISSGITSCGIPNPYPQKKVVGGKNSAFGSWPWQASVRRTSFFGFSSTHRCGGALVSRQWVATAGHCVDDLLLSQIKIRIGEYDFASIQEPHGYVERGVKKKVVHPRYNFFTYENDLALVQLEEAIDEEKYPHISPICLPPSEEDLIGKNATVTGWGRLSEGGVLPSILQEVQVPIISNEKCKNMFLTAGRHEYIPDIFLCAGFEEGGRDSCQGDSGGPLQIQSDDGYWFLAGIISWGIGCAEPNMPGVCTRISKFKNWVLQNIA